jgi:tetratricopeptide (TPR) repeat protein
MSTKGRSPNSSKVIIGCITILLVPLIVVAVFLLLRKSELNPAMKGQLDVADAAYREGKFDEAEAGYLDAYALAPLNATVLEQLGTLALWKNDLEQAERYFKDALIHTPWYRNFWPFNTQLKYRLGMTYYRQDRFTDVARLFEEARGPMAIGPFRELEAFAAQMALFEKTDPYLIEGPEESLIEFVTTDPLPVIEVSINGNTPRYFIIDTGGMEVILDDQLADEIGAEMAGALTGSYAGGKKAVTGLGKIDSISIGDFVMYDVPIHTLDIESVSYLFDGLKIQGIIGTRLLMHFLSTIDYANGALLLKRMTPANLESLNSRIERNEGKVIPFWLAETHYILAYGSVNDLKPTLFFVDTGLAGAGFTAPETVLQEAGIEVDWTKAQVGIGGGGEFEEVDILVDRLTLGTGANEIVEYQILGKANEDPASILGDQLGFNIGGLISHQFFRKYALTLDFTGMRLIVE